VPKKKLIIVIIIIIIVRFTSLSRSRKNKSSRGAALRGVVSYRPKYYYSSDRDYNIVTHTQRQFYFSTPLIGGSWSFFTRVNCPKKREFSRIFCVSQIFRVPIIIILYTRDPPAYYTYYYNIYYIFHRL